MQSIIVLDSEKSEEANADNGYTLLYLQCIFFRNVSHKNVITQMINIYFWKWILTAWYLWEIVSKFSIVFLKTTVNLDKNGKICSKLDFYELNFSYDSKNNSKYLITKNMKFSWEIVSSYTRGSGKELDMLVPTRKMKWDM